MAGRWIRGVAPHTSGNVSGTDGLRLAGSLSLMLYYFVRHLLGFTLVDEVVAGGKSFENSYIASGTDGEFAGSDFVFSAISATFVYAELRRCFLVIEDSVNPVNCGVYEILTVPSGTTCTIDFHTGQTIFPTASTGMKWWVYSDLTAPTTAGDFAVLRSPHSTGWELKIDLLTRYSSYVGPRITVCSESGWNSSTHDWNSGASVLATNSSYQFSGPSGYYTHSSGPLVYMYGDTSGDFLTCISESYGQRVATSLFGSMFSVLEMFVPGHTERERLWAFGPEIWRSLAYYLTGSYGSLFTERYGSLTSVKVMFYRLTGGTFGSKPTGIDDKLPVCPLQIYVDTPVFMPWGYVNPERLAFIGTGDRNLALGGSHLCKDKTRTVGIRYGMSMPWPGVPLL